MIETDTHVYFVGDFLSNWYRCGFNMRLAPSCDEWEFNCSEQAFIAAKAMMFNDYEMLHQIMSARDPRKQKEYGRKVARFDFDRWLQVAYKHMYRACLAKFQQNKYLKDRLLETGNKIIVEAAWYDMVWGVGLREDDPLILDKANWTGTNWLGKTLMLVRERVEWAENDAWDMALTRDWEALNA
jgi:ribA/ribD-fused uncharacterized protein